MMDALAIWRAIVVGFDWGPGDNAHRLRRGPESRPVRIH
jgi:hypothetical protein